MQNWPAHQPNTYGRVDEKRELQYNISIGDYIMQCNPIFQDGRRVGGPRTETDGREPKTMARWCG